MRYAPGRKEETRSRLLHAGAAIAKKQGFASTGIDRFMAAVGLSGAAFYAHFGSKVEFFKAILQRELECSRALLAGPPVASPLERIERYFANYLSLAHVKNPEHGCPLPALSQEVAGADATTKRLYEEQVERTHAAMEECLGDADAAWAALAVSVGGVLIARAMHSRKRQEQLLTGCRSVLSKLAASAASGPDSREQPQSRTPK